VDARLLATDHIKTLDLVRELALSETDFKQVFHGSAILRAKHSGYLRNIALVIRDHPSSESRDALIRIIRHEREPYLRAAAVWAITPMVDDGLKQELSTLITMEKDLVVLRELNETLHSGT
jgi:epoxyqueuosine reductase QueG